MDSLKSLAKATTSHLCFLVIYTATVNNVGLFTVLKRIFYIIFF